MAQVRIIANTAAPSRPGRYTGETRSDVDCYRTLIAGGHLPSVAQAITRELMTQTAPRRLEQIAVLNERVLDRLRRLDIGGTTSHASHTRLPEAADRVAALGHPQA